MKISTLIGAVISVVIGVSLIGVVLSGVDTAKGFNNESFVAEGDDTTAEDITLSEAYEDGSFDDGTSTVRVNGELVDASDITEDNDETGEISLAAAASDTGDEIDVRYLTADGELPGAVSTLVDLLPLLFVVIIVAGIAGIISRFHK